jgi:hypothetical protein
MIRPWLVAGFVAAALVAPPVQAQTSSPPARPDLSGTWTLDTEVSTDLAKINLIPSTNSAAPQSGGMRRGGGFGGFGGGRSFGGGRQRNQSSAPKLTSDEQTRLKAIADVLKSGWTKLTLSLHEPNFVVNDARDRTSFFTTDGTAADNHVDQSTVPTTSRWDGERLVTEYTIGPDITLVYSYRLVANMKRLVVRIERKDGQNTRQFDPDVYLLYRRSS